MQYDSIWSDRGRSKKKLKYKGDKKSQSRSQSSTCDCKYCGSNHQCRQCPAYGKVCKACGKKTIWPRNVILENKLNAPMVLNTNHSNMTK